MVEVEASAQRRSQERQLAAGRESLEDSLGASEQVVHFQVPRHETCVAKLSWISEIRRSVTPLAQGCLGSNLTDILS